MITIPISDVFRLYSKTISFAEETLSDEDLQRLDDLLWTGIEEYLKEIKHNEF